MSVSEWCWVVSPFYVLGVVLTVFWLTDVMRRYNWFGCEDWVTLAILSVLWPALWPITWALRKLSRVGRS